MQWAFAFEKLPVITYSGRAGGSERGKDLFFGQCVGT